MAGYIAGNIFVQALTALTTTAELNWANFNDIMESTEFHLPGRHHQFRERRPAGRHRSLNTSPSNPVRRLHELQLVRSPIMPLDDVLAAIG